MTFIVDMTTAFNALHSLEDWLNIKENDILEYVSQQKQIYYVNNFIEQFNIENTSILNGTLKLASLHVTTNNDNCDSIKKLGLMNLQDTLRLNTSLGNYIREQGIIINIDDMIVEYKGKIYDLKSKADNAVPGSKEHQQNFVTRKLYEDYQINGFLCNENALDYVGGIARRPEFLGNLASMLEDRRIEFDWVNSKNKCYVLKYYADIADFEHYTFNVKIRNELDYIENKEVYELQKRKWLIVNALTVIFDNMFGSSLPEFFSYAKFDTNIPFEEIEIFSDNEYLEKFNIKN